MKKSAAKQAPTKTIRDNTLITLCQRVSSFQSSYDDCAEQIENRAYADCENGLLDSTVQILQQLAVAFESLADKNEENVRDLADIYLLIGDIHQYTDHHAPSVIWYKKAAIVDDRYALPFHHLAISYLKLNDRANAIKCFEQEISLSPGNYFSYHLLANTYEADGQSALVEHTFKRLLERDEKNIQALHGLIVHYRTIDPDIKIEFLRKRLIAIERKFSEIELLMVLYHLLEDGHDSKALDLLLAREERSPEMAIINLLKAHLFAKQKNFAQKRRELLAFKQKCHGNHAYIKNKLHVFATVFGEKAEHALQRQLII